MVQFLKQTHHHLHDSHELRISQVANKLQHNPRAAPRGSADPAAPEGAAEDVRQLRQQTLRKPRQQLQRQQRPQRRQQECQRRENL